MNEQINISSKYSPEDIEYLNRIVKEIIDSYEDNEKKVNLKTGSEHIIYTKINGSKVMFPKWEKMSIKDKDPVDMEEYIKKVINEDLEQNKKKEV